MQTARTVLVTGEQDRFTTPSLLLDRGLSSSPDCSPALSGRFQFRRTLSTCGIFCQDTDSLQKSSVHVPLGTHALHLTCGVANWMALQYRGPPLVKQTGRKKVLLSRFQWRNQILLERDFKREYVTHKHSIGDAIDVDSRTSPARSDGSLHQGAVL